MRLISARIIFAWIFFGGCKFCYISSEFVFSDGEILINFCGRIFAVAIYMIFMSSMIIAERK